MRVMCMRAGPRQRPCFKLVFPTMLPFDPHVGLCSGRFHPRWLCRDAIPPDAFARTLLPSSSRRAVPVAAA